MKKTLMAGLTGAIILGSMGTSFAASNPFTDVPRGHWAYDAVEQLRQDGIIEGYGDGTYRGERTITRYEMAQMIARALDQYDSKIEGLSGKSGQPTVVQNVGADKAMLDRLAAEFADELNSLGVRVSNLEKYSDKITWTGKIEYTYTSSRVEQDDGHKEKENSNGYVFRLEPKAEINDHWTANARLDVEGDFKDDSMTDVQGKRVWAQGDYDNFTIKAGKFELYTNENGLIFDDELSGGQLDVNFGDVTFTALGGRLDVSDSALADALETTNNDDTANFWGVNLQYAHENGFEIGAGYYQVNSDMFKLISTDADDDNKIWSANIGYNFTDRAKLWGAYDRSNIDTTSNHKYSWQAEFDYGTYDDASEKGQWGIYGAYRRYGWASSIFPTGDGVDWGQKGWEVGVSYAPLKNVGLVAKYFNGEELVGGNDAEKLFGRVELFF